LASAACIWASLPLWAAPATAGGNAIFQFVSWCLVVIAAITLAWPVNVPLAALAYKIRNGPNKIDMDAEDFWWRCGFAALCLFGVSAVTLGLVYLFVDRLGLPSGLTHLVLLLAYLPVCVWIAFWAFALEDMLQGLGLFVIYVLLPGLPLLWIGRLTGLWTWLAQAAPWLFTPG
jgi:hypothetical protein